MNVSKEEIYKVLKATSVVEIENAVNRIMLTKKNVQLVGGMGITNTDTNTGKITYCQAVVHKR